jgi:hypothetical protein
LAWERNHDLKGRGPYVGADRDAEKRPTELVLILQPTDLVLILNANHNVGSSNDDAERPVGLVGVIT